MKKKSTQMLMDTFQSKESHGIKQEHHFRCAEAQIRERHGVLFSVLGFFFFFNFTNTHILTASKSIIRLKAVLIVDQ